MSLLDVQRSLVGFARGSQTEYLACTQLSANEDAWLHSLLQSPGLMVTQQIQQWWRLSRICLAAPMTVALLKRNGMEQLIIDYITNEPVRSLFFAAELDQFKAYLHAHLLVNHLTKTLVAFEAGLKNIYQACASTHLSPDANTETLSCIYQLHFTCDPLQLFSALLTGAALPAEDSDYYVTLDPKLPQHWCVNTQAPAVYLAEPRI
jgi:hypothetical protein